MKKTTVKQAQKMASDRKRWLEILAVFITGAMKYILMDWLEMRALYIGTACVFWITFIYKRYRDDQYILRRWGFRKDHFKPEFLFLLPFALVVVAAIIGYGIYDHATFLNWHIIPILVFYPSWGVIQQFLMIALVAGILTRTRYGKIFSGRLSSLSGNEYTTIALR